MEEMWECEICDEMFPINDLNDRNDCGCKLLCDKCVIKHDKEHDTYLAHKQELRIENSQRKKSALPAHMKMPSRAYEQYKTLIYNYKKNDLLQKMYALRAKIRIEELDTEITKLETQYGVMRVWDSED